MNKHKILKEFKQLNKLEQTEVITVIKRFLEYPFLDENNYRFTFERKYQEYTFEFVEFENKSLRKFENWVFRVNAPNTVNFLLNNSFIEAKHINFSANEVLKSLKAENSLLLPKPFTFNKKQTIEFARLIKLNRSALGIPDKEYPDDKDRKDIVAEYQELTMYKLYNLYKNKEHIYSFSTHKNGQQGKFLKFLMLEQSEIDRPITSMSIRGRVSGNFEDHKKNINTQLRKSGYRITLKDNAYRIVPLY